MDPQLYSQLIFHKAGKNIQWKKKSLQQMVLEKHAATCRGMTVDHLIIPYTKINSKWMKNLNVTQETIKILKENTGSNLYDIGLSNFLLDTSPEARETKAKINYWDFIKIKIFCTMKDTINKTKGNIWDRGRYL